MPNHRHGPQTTALHDVNDGHEALHIPPMRREPSAEELPLSTVPIGSTAKVAAVNAEGALRRRLLDMGITPGTVIRVYKRAPMGDPLELKLRGYSLSLRKDDAAKISVLPQNGGAEL